MNDTIGMFHIGEVKNPTTPSKTNSQSVIFSHEMLGKGELVFYELYENGNKTTTLSREVANDRARLCCYANVSTMVSTVICKKQYGGF